MIHSPRLRTVTTPARLRRRIVLSYLSLSKAFCILTFCASLASSRAGLHGISFRLREW